MCLYSQAKTLCISAEFKTMRTIPRNILSEEVVTTLYTFKTYLNKIGRKASRPKRIENVGEHE